MAAGIKVAPILDNPITPLKRPDSYPKTPEDSANGQAGDDGVQLFRDAVAGIKPLAQDKVTLPRNKKLQNQKILQNKRRQQEQKRSRASFEFSDGFQAHFDLTQPLKYSRNKTFSGEVKRLRQGIYAPEVTLDLHGYNRENAKAEIADLLHYAKKQHYYCICIVHGIGSRILKQHIPNWLVQHPDVVGFHEAPLEWGGKGALLVLLTPPEHILLQLEGR